MMFSNMLKLLTKQGEGGIFFEPKLLKSTASKEREISVLKNCCGGKSEGCHIDIHKQKK